MRTRSPMYLGQALQVIGQTPIPVAGARLPRSRWRRFLASLRRAWSRRKALGIEIMAGIAACSVMLFVAVLFWSRYFAQVTP